MVGAMAMHSKLAVTERQPKEWQRGDNAGLLAVCVFVAVHWI